MGEACSMDEREEEERRTCRWVYYIMIDVEEI
jgi:hypothetical protein